MWHDRRDVTFLSTIHSWSVVDVQKRPKGITETEHIPCPTAIVEYNYCMNGVDIADQHLSYYSLTKRKTTKWWKKLFWRLIDMCILNSYCVPQEFPRLRNQNTSRISCSAGGAANKATSHG